MVQSKRLRPVQRIAESKELTAARELGDSRRYVHKQEERLNELRQYHAEYLERFHATAKIGMSALQLQEYRAFLAKLERAIREQEEIIAKGRNVQEFKKGNWQQKHVRTQILGNVIDRYKKSESKANDKREQNEADDRSQRNPGK
ncbi:MAG: flagellar export protein FliJ [Gammaproteobacteria bacterium]|jgi:flagellar protein FliJ